MPTPAPSRRGYSSRSAIPPGVLARLNRAEEPTITLSEWLAVDLSVLCTTVFTQLEHPDLAASSSRLATSLAADGVGIMQRLRDLALHIYSHTPAKRRPSLLRALASHPADIPRQLAALTLPHQSLELTELLLAVRPFAADSHMGVREIAWMVLRPALTHDLLRALELLLPWAGDPDPNVRRCAIEATRPRAVWCAHIAELKTNPGLAQPLLELVKSDPARYVQNSVANWLNDAGKSQPAWLRDLADKWAAESPTTHTQYILRRGLRSVPPPASPSTKKQTRKRH